LFISCESLARRPSQIDCRIGHSRAHDERRTIIPENDQRPATIITFISGGVFISITVEIATPLRRLTDGTCSVTCTAANLTELFSDLDQKFPNLRPHLHDEAGEPRRFLNIYVNEEDIRFLGGLGYAFQEGDEVILVPSVAGGAH
jgi:sulfur-carrier protein